MPKSDIQAIYIRHAVPNNRIPVSDMLDGYFDTNKMAVLEIGMQKGNLDPDQGYLTAKEKTELIDNINSFNTSCRELGVPIIHIGAKFRVGGIDFNQAHFMRTLALSGQKAFPNPKMEEGSPLCEFAVEVKKNDYLDYSLKRYNTFEGTDIEFLLKVLKKEIIVLTGFGSDCFALGTGFAGICKDYKAILAEDLFKPYEEKLGEGTKRIFSLFIGLVLDSKDLVAELKLQNE